jgi:hypothetical protein
MIPQKYWRTRKTSEKLRKIAQSTDPLKLKMIPDELGLFHERFWQEKFPKIVRNDSHTEVTREIGDVVQLT